METEVPKIIDIRTRRRWKGPSRFAGSSAKVPGRTGSTAGCAREAPDNGFMQIGEIAGPIVGRLRPR